MLSKKYYCIIAKAIKDSQSKNELIEKLCSEFRADNPNFDSLRFRNASSEE